MEALKKLWNTIVGFIQQDYNLYYCIAALVAIVVVIIIIAVCATKRKKKKEIASDIAITEDTAKAAEQEVILNSDLEQIRKEEALAKSTAPYGSSVAVEYKHIDVVAQPMAAAETKVKASTTVNAAEKKVGAPAAAIKEPVAAKKEKLTKAVEVQPIGKKTKVKAVPVKKEEDEPEEKQVILTKIDAKREEDAEAIKSNPKRSGFIQIYQDAGGKFRFRIKASNKETVAHSQGYTTKGSCKNGIKAVASIVDSAIIADTTKTEYLVTIGKPAFEIYKDSDNKFRFRLRAANTSNVLASQGYTSKENCFNGIKSVKFIALNFALEDSTIAAAESNSKKN